MAPTSSESNGRARAKPISDANGLRWFEQVWFAGNRSDIGGSESRLSDIALDWMSRTPLRCPTTSKSTRTSCRFGRNRTAARRGRRRLCVHSPLDRDHLGRRKAANCRGQEPSCTRVPLRKD
ncbi:phospholipase effector Tle1 domain-containing protein [Bradyrhizobium manausense]|uniref:phospholipase effector Tle1 domain-containing protein n=1 Tax=Bradyrhizobium manausense TaxID=989370 RepID=UPI003D321E8C